MHLQKSETTIAEVLKENGYATGYFGTRHACPESQESHPRRPRFRLLVRPRQQQGRSHRTRPSFCSNGKTVGEMKGYSCHVVVDEALTWLDQKRDADEPFFLNLWFNEPHAPIAAMRSFPSMVSSTIRPRSTAAPSTTPTGRLGNSSQSSKNSASSTTPSSSTPPTTAATGRSVAENYAARKDLNSRAGTAFRDHLLERRNPRRPN